MSVVNRTRLSPREVFARLGGLDAWHGVSSAAGKRKGFRSEGQMRGRDIAERDWPKNRHHWVSVNVTAPTVAGGRESDRDISSVVGLPLDLDVKAGSFPDTATAWSFVDALGERVGESAGVGLDSGSGGLNLIWRVDDGDPTRMKELLSAWRQTVYALRDEKFPGVTIDDIFQPSRILRLPGSWNPEYDTEVVAYDLGGQARSMDEWLAALDAESGDEEDDDLDDLDDWNGEAPYSGPRWAELSEEGKRAAQLAQDREFEALRRDLVEAALWDEGRRDEAGRGWHDLVRNAVYIVSRWHASGWTPLSAVGEDGLAAFIADLIPDELARACRDDLRLTRNTTERAAVSVREDPLRAPREVWGLDPAFTDPLPSMLDNDYAIVRWLAARLAGTVLHDITGRTVWRWDGTRWVETSMAWYRDLARAALTEQVADEIVREADDRRLKRLATMLRLNGVNTMIAAAADRPELQVDSAKMDADPFLLNCSNGTVDLRTGELRGHDPADLITKTTGCAFRPGARHELVDRILEALSPEVREWLQRRLGEALIGQAGINQSIYSCVGGGANGKSTLFQMLEAGLGGYFAWSPSQMLTDGAEAHPYTLMTVKGVRVAVVEEVPEKPIQPDRIKVLTSPQITARGMHQDPVTFRAVHTLLVSTNHPIGVGGAKDHGTYRRLKQIPFERTFAPDPAFAEAVNSGGLRFAEAVLAWLWAGLEDARLIGPEAAPEAVAKAGEDLRLDQDRIYSFVTTWLEYDPEGVVRVQDLYEGFRASREEDGERFIGQRQFYKEFFGHQLIKGRGLDQRSSDGRNWGERVRASAMKGVISDRPKDLLDGEDRGTLGDRIYVVRGLRWRNPT